MDRDHRLSDRQSLLLTQAAVDALRREPALFAAVQATLDHWDRIAPTHSKELRDEWRDILCERQFDRALATTDRGQPLRQASPLGRALSPKQRLEIIRSCKGRSSNT